MESSCLLCFEFNRDLVGFIEANSNRWREFDITKVLEKHLWPMNTIQPSSWICLSCWQVIDGFNNFYLRIQEAHLNFGKIKVKGEYNYWPPKEENPDVSDPNVAYDCLEPEILLDQNVLEGIADNSECSAEESKYHTEDNIIDYKDPLEKSNTVNIKNRGNSKTSTDSKFSTPYIEDVKVKSEPADKKDYDSLSDNDEADEISSKIGKTEKRSSRKENDKFIDEHFKQMICDLCDTPFHDFSAMLKHFSTVHNQNGYLVCCNRKFHKRKLLVDHLHCHLDPDYFKCNQCGKILSDRKTLEIHILHVHRPDDVVKKHSCEICGKSFIKGCLLRAHKLTHMSKEEKRFPCNECGKFYGSSYSLKLHTDVVHLKKHSKICYICGKSLGTSTEYKAHMNKHDGITPPIINCDVCGLRLTSERSLKLHKETQHPIGGKKEHPCPVCHRVSPTARALKKHIVTMHEQGYNHKCSVCEKAFKRAETLKEHMAQHTGETLYTCPWCPKTFNSNGNMHAHRKNVHPKESLELKLQKYSRSIPPETS